ncbi:MAG: helix-turn-helix transcriptional regulator [Alphaproteobacteria bacterium]|nr:helix-turn-helix transcriptional regulator [Alphaproteobacteria bacterium]
MLTHEQIWHTIDRLATSFGYSPSGLAKQAGLDPTTFNKSKRFGPEGKPRWPSTESISRILGATGATMSDFLALVDETHSAPSGDVTIPVIGFAQAGAQGYFDEEGYPKGDSWDEISFPQISSGDQDGLYALKVSGDSMLPLYREGDVLIISPKSNLRAGDRIILKTTGGEVMAKELVKQNNARVELRSLNPAHENRKIPLGDIAWMARVIWVSQ